jgi:hypothetical protein
MEGRRLDVDVLINRSPAAVRAWWTDLPDEYTAADPTERPHRIITTQKLATGRKLTTFWHGSSGEEIRIDETLTLRPDGGWEFDLIHPGGYEIHQLWRAVEDRGKTRLEVRATVVPLNEKARDGIEAQLRWMEELWRASGRICERDAPEPPSAGWPAAERGPAPQSRAGS